GIAAEERLTQALCMLTDNDCGADTNRLVVALRRREVTAELGRRLGRWLVGREGGKTLAEEARALRNAATHRFYDKRGRPRGEWHYEVDTGRGQFRDGLVLEFASAYARHLDELRAI